jgi:hypothetical protein
MTHIAVKRISEATTAKLKSFRRIRKDIHWPARREHAFELQTPFRRAGPVQCLVIPPSFGLRWETRKVRASSVDAE